MRRASNRNVMAWTFMGNTRMHQVLREKVISCLMLVFLPLKFQQMEQSARRELRSVLSFLMLRNGHILNGF